jgi:hypothetical protein
MRGTSRPALTFAVLTVSGGCQLVVPSDAELSGGTRAADAGSDTGNTGDVGAPPVEAGTDAADAGGVSLVQQTSATGSSTSSVVLTLAAAPRNGDALVLTIASVANTGASFTVSGGGVAWSEKSRASVHVESAVWVGLGASSGTTSVTVTASSTQTVFLTHLSEWTGLSAFGPSVKNDGVGSPATSPLAVPDGTTLIYAAAAAHNVTLGPPANGFVGLQTVRGANVQIEQAYRVSPPAGSYRTSWNEASPSTNGWDAHVLSFTR